VLLGRVAESIAARVGAWSRRQAARLLVSRALDLHVEGLEHVPASGPAILVARHYHHLYDAAAVLASAPREVHVLIALDWLGTGRRMRLMRWLAGAARWPGVWRSGPGWRLNRDGYRQSLQVLREGGLLLVFPEGYPTIDPVGMPQKDAGGFGPFKAGFLVLAKRAGVQVPVVPVGLWYSPRPRGGWTVWLRLGEPIFDQQLATIESTVRTLSRAPCPISAHDSREPVAQAPLRTLRPDSR
jgi:1-acyl-sn-glycerol-3-phosphate acyltransferase